MITARALQILGRDVIPGPMIKTSNQIRICDRGVGTKFKLQGEFQCSVGVA